ncbi:MAG: hypothetical protein QXJ42_05355 [Desulfurococcaceae archaeon]
MNSNYQTSSADLRVTLILNSDEYSSIIREIIEYAVDLIREKYGFKVLYKRVIDSNLEFPLLLINEFEPIVFTEIPSLDSIVKLLFVCLKTRIDETIGSSNLDNTVSI